MKRKTIIKLKNNLTLKCSCCYHFGFLNTNKMRVRNLELRKCIGKNERFEIVKWQFYEKDKKEFCYVIYFIEKGIIDFIGNRPLELESIQEYNDSLFLLRKSIKKSIRYKIPQSCSQAE